MTAPSSVNVDCIVCACEVAVLRALEVAGKRARNSSRQNRARMAMPLHLIHTRFPLALTHEDCDRLLVDAWDHLRIAVPNQQRLYTAVDWYVRQLIVMRRAHTREELHAVVAVVYE